MSLTDRDRKIVIAIVPLLVLVGYWFFLLAPKRQDSSTLGDQLTRQETKRDKLQAEVANLNAAQKSFGEDYATVVKLGKAVPTSVDMPSLIVQLSSAAKGTGISFERIKAGPRQSSSADSSSSGGSSAGSSGSGTPASAAGGEAAKTGLGSAAEKANNTKSTADQKAAQTAGSGSSSGSSATPGSSGTTGTAPQGLSVPGLDSVPLEFTFRGGFFGLTDFFHQLKRFVRVANDRIAVHGRLMTVNGFNFKTSVFPRLEAQVFATVYLTPKVEGQTAGATPGGPSPAPGGAQATPASSGSSPATPPATPPAAVSAP